MAKSDSIIFTVLAIPITLCITIGGIIGSIFVAIPVFIGVILVFCKDISIFLLSLVLTPFILLRDKSNNRRRDVMYKNIEKELEGEELPPAMQKRRSLFTDQPDDDPPF